MVKPQLFFSHKCLLFQATSPKKGIKKQGPPVLDRLIVRQAQPHALRHVGRGQLQLDAPVVIPQNGEPVFLTDGRAVLLQVGDIAAPDEQAGVLVLKEAAQPVQVRVGQDILRRVELLEVETPQLRIAPGGPCTRSGFPAPCPPACGPADLQFPFHRPARRGTVPRSPSSAPAPSPRARSPDTETPPGCHRSTFPPGWCTRVFSA